MSTNKKFRIQNGVDVVGELSINDVTVIGADGKIVAGAIQEAVAELTAADIADLQAQVTAILGTSPETLDTLQEIVTAFQDADTNLVASVASNSSDIATINDTLTNGVATPADVAANTAAIAAANARTSGISTSSGSSNIQMTADLDMGGNKVLFSNMYSTEADLPSASDNHGMFAHVHATGAGYFAHAGAWVKLANDGSVTTSVSDETAARIAGDAANSAEVTAAISTAAADATSKADAAQADAEATASADATSKANTAKSEAISTASADATSKANAAIATASADATSKANAAETAAKAHADQVVAATVDAAPAALDTLNELAAALGDDANFASTVTASIATKANDAATTAALALKADQTSLDTLDAFVGDGDPVNLVSMNAGDWIRVTNGNDDGTFASINAANNPAPNILELTSTQTRFGYQTVNLSANTTYTISFKVSGTNFQIAEEGGFYLNVVKEGATLWPGSSNDFVEPNISGYFDFSVGGPGEKTFTFYNDVEQNASLMFYMASGSGSGTWAFEDMFLGNPSEVTSLDTAASKVVPAINELHTELNALSSTQSSDQSNLQAQINSEVIRATAAEAANAANIVSETSARTSADNALESDIISLQNQVGTIIQGSPASLDTLVEIVSAFETADASLSGVITANGGRLTTAENNITALQTDLDAEETARGAGDAALAAEIVAATTLVAGDGISVDNPTNTVSLDGSAISQDLVPSADNVYALGSPDKVWKDVYIGPGSLYIAGQKVIEDNSGTITINADPDQNLTVQTRGTGGLSVQSTGSGGVSVDAASEAISFKSDVVMSSGKTISTTGGAATQFGGDVDMQGNTIGNIADPVSAQDAVSKTWVESFVADPHSGVKTFSDDVVVTGNLTVRGSTTTVESEIVKISDNLIDINSNVSSGSPTENAGIRVMRGDESPAQLRWNEGSNHWETYNGSAFTKIALSTSDLAEGSNQYFTEQRAKDCFTGGLCITYNSSTGVIAIDEAEVATSLKTAESFASDDADKLDGQQGTYYRINVYDVNGSLVN